jgi:hypothetical protein
MDRGFLFKKSINHPFPCGLREEFFTNQQFTTIRIKDAISPPPFSTETYASPLPHTLFWPQAGTTPPPHLHPSIPLLACICFTSDEVGGTLKHQLHGATTGLYHSPPAGVSWRSLARIRPPRHVTLTQQLCVLSPGGRGLTAKIRMCVPISSVVVRLKIGKKFLYTKTKCIFLSDMTKRRFNIFSFITSCKCVRSIISIIILGLEV